MGRPVKTLKDWSGFIPRLLVLKKSVEKSDRPDHTKKTIVDLCLLLIEQINADAQRQTHAQTPKEA